jgi:hypothetical protein
MEYTRVFLILIILVIVIGCLMFYRDKAETSEQNVKEMTAERQMSVEELGEPQNP